MMAARRIALPCRRLCASALSVTERSNRHHVLGNRRHMGVETHLEAPSVPPVNRCVRDRLSSLSRLNAAAKFFHHLLDRTLPDKVT